MGDEQKNLSFMNPQFFWLHRGNILNDVFIIDRLYLNFFHNSTNIFKDLKIERVDNENDIQFERPLFIGVYVDSSSPIETYKQRISQLKEKGKQKFEYVFTMKSLPIYNFCFLRNPKTNIRFRSSQRFGHIAFRIFHHIIKIGLQRGKHFEF